MTSARALRAAERNRPPGRPHCAPGKGKVAVFSMVRPVERALLDARAVELQRSRSSVIRSAILAYFAQPEAVGWTHLSGVLHFHPFRVIPTAP